MIFGNSNQNEQTSNVQKMHLSNDEFTNPSALHYRLDTSRMIKEIEGFLKGELTVYDIDETGRTQAYLRKIGSPLVNDLGVQCILTYLNCLLNSAIVQGNWGMAWYKYKIADIRRHLSLTMTINTYNWEISEGNYLFIIDTILDTLSGFLSRLIDNKEREALMPSVKTIETSNIRS